jgi:hypothetical protein
VSDDGDEHERTTADGRVRLASPIAEREEFANYLVLIEGSEPGRRILLKPGILTVGRDAARDVVLADPDVSRRDLDRASQYVRALLPAPLVTGPVRTDWLLQPSAHLGGDAFGYEWLSADAALRLRRSSSSLSPVR